MNNKKKYRALCTREITIPIFSRPWWLDAVCSGGEWDVCLVEKGEQILASMPYYSEKRFGLTYLVEPALTQSLGPWIRTTQLRHSKVLTQEKVLMEDLISQLPTYDHFSQNWHYARTNWLPFYWKGFSQTTRYTYVIDDLTNLESVFSRFEHSKRKDIKKAEGIVGIYFDISAEEFYENHRMTLAKQGAVISYSMDHFRKIYDAGYANNSAVTIAAVDESNNLHAALFVVWDECSAYDLISTIDPDFRTFGAASLLVREAISYVSRKTKKFDFEGSMIESVERSFRHFGAKQVPYFNIRRTPSLVLRTRAFTRNLYRW